jgi:hypothetical protein
VFQLDYVTHLGKIIFKKTKRNCQTTLLVQVTLTTNGLDYGIDFVINNSITKIINYR